MKLLGDCRPLLVVFCLPACTMLSPPIWETDNARIRELQKFETERHPVPDSERRELKQYVAERTAFIAVAEGKEGDDTPTSLPWAGRGAALTVDGYYLSAYHVVGDHPFFLVTWVPTGSVDLGPRLRRFKLSIAEPRFDRGRLVWFDRKLDLALLKFEQSSVPHFEVQRKEVAQGSLVFTADEHGVSHSVPGRGRSEAGGSDREGNGPFFAGGEVLSSRAWRGRGYRQLSTVVGRKGMSGTPVVTRDREMCGVLTSIVLGWSGPPKSEATMADPTFLFERIEADRRGSGGPPPPVSDLASRD